MDIQIKPKRRLPIGWLGLVAGVAGIAFIASAGWLSPGQPSVPAADVRFAEVERGAFVLDVNVSGTLVPRDIRWLGSRTGGQVEQVHVEPGTFVSAGDAILVLSEPELLRARDEASWRVSVERANAAELDVRLAEEELEQRMRVAEAEAEHESSRLELEAERELAERQIVSRIRLRQSELETAKLERRVAMEAERATLWTKSRDARRDAQAARIRQLADLVADLERRVEELTLRSPIDGVIDALETLPGETVRAGARIARVVSPEDLIARVRVPEYQAARLARGQDARLRIGTIDVAAEVTRIDPAVVDGTVEVDLAAAESLPAAARPDLTVSARIIISEAMDALTVSRPLNARERTQIGLYRLRPGSMVAERVTVRVGRIGADRMEVLGGLEPGDRIIVSDTRRFVAHESIIIRRAGEAS